MPIEDEVFKLVPVGEENAVSSRLLWQQMGMWSASGVRAQLRAMAAQGVVRRKVKRRGPIELTLYFRDTATAP
jgi:hypothetical protein